MMGKYLHSWFSRLASLGKRWTAGDPAANAIIGSALFLSGVLVWVGGYVVEALYNLADAVSAHRAPAKPGGTTSLHFFFFQSLVDGRGNMDLESGNSRGRSQS